MAAGDASKIVAGDEALMAQKGHGTCRRGPQAPLRFGVDAKTADEICCFNRHYAEHSGYFRGKPGFAELIRKGGEVTFYDSIENKPVFIAPRGRTAEAFLAESADHGWPSFRDSEVVWENVRVLTRGASASGETVTVDGVHLGHNLPDRHGNRYCINLVCVAGPGGEGAEAEAGQQPAGKVDL